VRTRLRPMYCSPNGSSVLRSCRCIRDLAEPSWRPGRRCGGLGCHARKRSFSGSGFSRSVPKGLSDGLAVGPKQVGSADRGSVAEG
jgi:hypothetical protein